MTRSWTAGWSVAAAKVRRIKRIAQEPMSLETPVGTEENSYLGDFIEDDSLPGPVDQASRQLLKEQMEEILDGLSERERKVLEMRFGLEDGTARTLEEVGQEFGVTRERIRQIEAKALRKLRHPIRSRKLATIWRDGRPTTTIDDGRKRMRERQRTRFDEAALAIMTRADHSSIAQLAEQAAVNRKVGGSSPPRGA